MASSYLTLDAMSDRHPNIVNADDLPRIDVAGPTATADPRPGSGGGSAVSSAGSMDSHLTRRLVMGLVLLVAVVFGGGLGYYAIGRGEWPLFDCIYMTVITVTTVGYGEVLRDMEHVAYARTFTVILLVFGTGSIVYFASTITAFIIEGDLRNALFASRLKKRMKRMKDHVVVCGAGSTGRNVIEELLTTGVPVIAIDVREGELREIAEKFPRAEFSYIVGDATDDDVMAQTGLERARGLVAALSSDKDNLYLTVSGRQTNPGARIVARCAELSHVEKIRRSGADAVVSPNYIGGMRLVSELLRPAVVRFLDDMLRDRRAAYRIEEIVLGDGVAGLGATLREARVRERFGMTVLAVRAIDQQSWVYNPDADERLGPGMTLVVLGSSEQVAELRKAAA
jgi:voltage-gated potassium channel